MRNPQVAAAAEDEEELRVGDRQKSGARRKHAHGGGMGQQDEARASLGGPSRVSGSCGKPRSASVLPLSVESSPWRSCISCLYGTDAVCARASVRARACTVCGLSARASARVTGDLQIADCKSHHTRTTRSSLIASPLAEKEVGDPSIRPLFVVHRTAG